MQLKAEWLFARLTELDPIRLLFQRTQFHKAPFSYEWKKAPGSIDCGWPLQKLPNSVEPSQALDD